MTDITHKEPNFDAFMLHKRRFKYLGNTTNVQLGNGYSYTSKPISPLLKEFQLTFIGFRYYFNADGSIDYETNKTKNNLGALCQFYEEMNQFTTFFYYDKQFPQGVPVRFKEPLDVPDPVGNRGVVEDFSITLSEVGN